MRGGASRLPFLLLGGSCSINRPSPLLARTSFTQKWVQAGPLPAFGWHFTGQSITHTVAETLPKCTARYLTAPAQLALLRHTVCYCVLYYPALMFSLAILPLSSATHIAALCTPRFLPSSSSYTTLIKLLAQSARWAEKATPPWRLSRRSASATMRLRPRLILLTSICSLQPGWRTQFLCI